MCNHECMCRYEELSEENRENNRVIVRAAVDVYLAQHDDRLL